MVDELMQSSSVRHTFKSLTASESERRALR